MTGSELTKRILANGLKEMMKRTPLSHISVGDIAKYCGVNRNTFYYHFKDKYDLVNWIFSTEIVEYITANSHSAHWTEGVIQLCHYMKENRKFYINALSEMGQNSFSEYLFDFCRDFMMALFESIKDEKQIKPEEEEYLADFFTYGFVGMVTEWAKTGMKDDPDTHIEEVDRIMEAGFLKGATDKSSTFESEPDAQ